MAEDVLISVGADVSDLTRDMGKADKSVDKFGDSVDKADRKGKGFFGTIGGGIGSVIGMVNPIGLVVAGLGTMAGGLVGATKAAGDEAVGIERLTQTLNTNAKAWDGDMAKIEAVISQREKLGFADDQLRDSMNLLVRQTGDVTEAQSLQAMAMDLSRATGLDLASATKAVAKVDNESLGVLKKLGIAVDENMTKEQALAAIKQATAGQAEAYANTLSGSMDRVKTAMGNALEDIGGVILPGVTGAMQTFAEFLSGEGFQGAIATVAGFIGTVLGGAFSLLGQALGIVVPIIQSLAAYFQGVLDTGDPLNDFLTNLPAPLQGVALAFGQVVSFIQQFVQGFTTTIGQIAPQVMPILQGLFEQIVPMFQERLNAVMGIVQTVLQIITGFWQQNGADIIASVTGWLQTAGEIISSGLAIAQQIIMTVLGLIGQFFTQHKDEIIGILTMAWDTIKMVIDAALAVIQGVIIPILSGIASFISEHSDLIMGVLNAAWNIISSVIKSVLGIIQGVVKTVMGIIHGDWGEVWAGIQQIASSIWDGIKGIVQGGIDLVKSIITIAIEAIKGIWEGFWQHAGEFLSQAWDTILLTIGNALETIRSSVVAKFDEVMAFLSGLPGAIGAKGLEIATGLVNGIMSALAGLAQKFGDKLKSELDAGVNNVKNFFGIHSPSDETADQIGAPFAEGITQGFTEAMRQGSTQMLADMQNVMRSMADLVEQEMDRRNEEGIHGMFRAGLNGMFDFVESVWGPSLDAQWRFWFTRWQGYFNDFQQIVDNFSPPGGPGGGGGGGSGAMAGNRGFAAATAGAGGGAMQVNVYLDSKLVSQALATRQRGRQTGWGG